MKRTDSDLSITSPSELNFYKSLLHTIGATLVDYGNTSIANNYDTKDYTIDNPYGQNLICPLIQRLPNGNWVSGSINSFTVTDTTVTINVSFRNYYGSAVTGKIIFLLIGTE